MNAIQANEFTRALAKLGTDLTMTERPRAILVVSAHWQTNGSKVLTLERPPTIHDFGGFPRELFEVAYPAPGSPDVAAQVMALAHEVEGDQAWGLDHGTWSVLRHVIPNAEVPVLQLSLNKNLDLRGHFALAQSLRALRERGVLIVGSGNITHNLRVIDQNESAAPADWAVEFDALIRDALLARDLPQLFAERPGQRALWTLAHPSIDHYLPLLYAVGAADARDLVSFPIAGFQHATLSTRAVRFG